MANCLVLGGNGFIGSHLVDALVASGHSVRAFDRYSNSQIQFNDNPKVERFIGDFLNRSDLQNALKGIDYVFHFISTTTPITSEADPLIDVDTNIRMTIELLQECVDNGNIQKVIFASTGGSIYGLNSGGSVSEDVLPLPISPYAIGKLTIEHYLRYFEKKHGLNSLIYRISNPYGERQPLANKQGVIPIFLHRIAQHEAITVLGDGSMVRDYLYVKDAAQMIAESFATASEGVYNLGSGHGVSVNELVEVITEATGQDVQVNHEPKPVTFVEQIVLDTSKFEQEFNLKPQTELKDGVLKTWEYIKSHD